ncbi:MAG: HNH endonuclease, partial [Colwellia sp.]|nr:HNH endonuclease [Colwellia sp.]
GKRSSGYFALETLLGEKVHASANVKKNTVRLTARTTTLTQLLESEMGLVA